MHKVDYQHFFTLNNKIMKPIHTRIYIYIYIIFSDTVTLAFYISN